MKYCLAILALAFIFPTNADALDSSIYSNYTIPEFEYRSFYVDGDDLLNWTKTGDDSRTSFNFGGDYRFLSQFHSLSYYYGTNFDIDYDKDGEADATTVMQDRLDFGFQKYLGSYSGLSFGADAWLDLSKEADLDLEKLLDLDVYAGMGRLTNAQPLAQAIAIVDEVGGDDGSVGEIASIIAKATDYQVKYKDDWTLNYYGDIAEALGKPGAAMKVQQILTAAIYSISPRYTGYYLRGGYHNQFLTGLDPAPKGGVFAEFEYGKPMGLNAQFYAGARYDKSLEEGSGHDLSCYGHYWLDHSYTWASHAEVGFDIFLPEEGDADKEAYFLLETIKSITNKFSGSAALIYRSDPDPADAEEADLQARVKFIYHIF
ncbi:MAG: hypothetical protein QF492_03170 [Candidatus Krumholzibacteria bacterium]|jgi:hypothetical protein|nr:hypothetical protein [Candidatus Krumholzibacteria bacterium]MDP6668898.1 hypothetical protein [Candidatus Krumholzibacteria bacterium]MDP7022378.1 hypothetical protein [Candidatus Krumholzibacteria bacterium]